MDDRGKSSDILTLWSSARPRVSATDTSVRKVKKRCGIETSKGSKRPTTIIRAV